ncbi:MAG: hypothetical protein CVU03_04725 [Bacteroidetes bacterium HGW-Bacteroidetes-2]|jgi:hypothetical protein|nr:MAG: hypothetical protein CVU03_04725 [Bacteroidetes bacterium HGW-Bacteroidetes-2]
MKKIVLVFVLFLIFNSCIENKNKEYKQVENRVLKNKINPSVVSKIFDAHGGLTSWHKMKSLSFEIETSSGIERHITDLISRQATVESDVFKLGYDGDGVWLDEKKGSYSGNPKFYYNQMFYFYAMPFIIADDGAFYTERKDTIINRITYGVIHIGFERNIGQSPEDEYIIYYNKETFQMEWLGYTVTFFEGNKNTEWHYIKYASWAKKKDLLLPEKMVWYSTKNNRDFEPFQTVLFFKVEISETELNKSLFQAPEGSIYVE